jgi:hypothetical protein
MEFEVVDIPDVPPLSTGGSSAPVIEAMLSHVGKAILVPVDDRDPNAFRKTIRSALLNRGILDEYNYRTRVEPEKKTMTVWLERKPVVVNPALETPSNENHDGTPKD